MSDAARFRVDQSADRVIVTLDRPEVRNAIDAAMVSELHALCAELEARPRVLVLTGCGRQLCSGCRHRAAARPPA